MDFFREHMDQTPVVRPFELPAVTGRARTVLAVAPMGDLPRNIQPLATTESLGSSDSLVPPAPDTGDDLEIPPIPDVDENEMASAKDLEPELMAMDPLLRNPSKPDPMPDDLPPLLPKQAARLQLVSQYQEIARQTLAHLFRLYQLYQQKLEEARKEGQDERTRLIQTTLKQRRIAKEQIDKQEASLRDLEVQIRNLKSMSSDAHSKHAAYQKQAAHLSAEQRLLSGGNPLAVLPVDTDKIKEASSTLSYYIGEASKLEEGAKKSMKSKKLALSEGITWVRHARTKLNEWTQSQKRWMSHRVKLVALLLARYSNALATVRALISDVRHYMRLCKAARHRLLTETRLDMYNVQLAQAMAPQSVADPYAFESMRATVLAQIEAGRAELKELVIQYGGLPRIRPPPPSWGTALASLPGAPALQIDTSTMPKVMGGLTNLPMGPVDPASAFPPVPKFQGSSVGSSNPSEATPAIPAPAF